MVRSSAVVLCGVLASACLHRPAASPAERVDLLTFVIGDAATWPRIGTQAQDQVVDLDRREVCWVKYRVASEFECWRWDDRWIYHAVDHAVDARPGESYHFSDGRWLPRYLRMGETWEMEVPRNAQTWLLPDCSVDPSRSHPFPYRLALSWLRAQDLGPDLGVRDVLGTWRTRRMRPARRRRACPSGSSSRAPLAGTRGRATGASRGSTGSAAGP